jgi:hypothetical protein
MIGRHRYDYRFVALSLVLWAAAGCSPYDPLCAFYRTPECEETECQCNDGSIVSDCRDCPPLDPVQACGCFDGSTVSDCSLCPEPGWCPDGTVTFDGFCPETPVGDPPDPGGETPEEAPPPLPERRRQCSDAYWAYIRDVADVEFHLCLERNQTTGGNEDCHAIYSYWAAEAQARYLGCMGQPTFDPLPP